MTRFALAVAVLGLAGCGGGDTEPYTVQRSDVQKQCDSLMEAWCNSSLACVQSGVSPEDMLTEDEFSEQRYLCIDVAKRTCDAAVSASDDVDACRAAVETLDDADCEAVRQATADASDEIEVSMPASCAEVFVSG